MKYLRTSHIALLLVLLSPAFARAQGWTTKLDKDVRFYQRTDMGVLIVGTENHFTQSMGRPERLYGDARIHRWMKPMLLQYQEPTCSY